MGHPNFSRAMQRSVAIAAQLGSVRLAEVRREVETAIAGGKTFEQFREGRR